VRKRPLSLVAAGILLVAVDFRIVHIDLLPDVVGWVLVAVAALTWGQRAPFVLAVVAALASLPDLALTYHYDDIDPVSGRIVEDAAPGTAYDQRLAFDAITDVRGVLAVLALAAGGGALYLLIVMLERRATLVDDRESASQLWLARVLLAAAWVLPHVGVMAFQWLSGEGLDPVWNDDLELLALVGLAVALALVVGAAINRNRGWTATDAERDVSWAVLAEARGVARRRP
jgi:hypothetical protein